MLANAFTYAKRTRPGGARSRIGGEPRTWRPFHGRADGGVASFGSWSAVGAGASLLPGVNVMSLDPPKLLLQCVVDCVLHIELNDLLLV